MKKKLALFLAVTVIISCTPKEKSSSASKPVEQKQQGGRVAGSESKTDGKPPVKASDTAILSEPEGRDFLLYSDTPEQPVIQGDFDIGELQDLNVNDENTLKLIETAGAFLDSVATGDVNEKLIAGSKREFVMRNLAIETDTAGLLDYRIGIIDSAAETPSAAVRLKTDNGFTEGMIYFIREGEWKIDDFQTDFSQAGKKENDKTAWFPYNRVM